MFPGTWYRYLLPYMGMEYVPWYLIPVPYRWRVWSMFPGTLVAATPARSARRCGTTPRPAATTWTLYTSSPGHSTRWDHQSTIYGTYTPQHLSTTCFKDIFYCSLYLQFFKSNINMELACRVWQNKYTVHNGDVLYKNLPLTFDFWQYLCRPLDFLKVFFNNL